MCTEHALDIVEQFETRSSRQVVLLTEHSHHIPSFLFLQVFLQCGMAVHFSIIKFIASGAYKAGCLTFS